LEKSFFLRNFAPSKKTFTNQAQQFMKKLFFLFAVIGFLFTSCGNKDNGETAKLPSKMTITTSGTWGSETFFETFLYDDQNRITKGTWGYYGVNSNGDSTGGGERFFEITHNANGTIAIVEAESARVNFLHSGNTVTAIYIDDEGPDTTRFEINGRGQIVRIWGYDWEEIWTYNSNGNVVRKIDTWTSGAVSHADTIDFEYSPTVKAIFRHTSTPEWFIQFFTDNVLYPKHGYMPVRRQRAWSSGHLTWTYTEKDGYVDTRTERWISVGQPPIAAKSLRDNNRANRFRSEMRRNAPVRKSSAEEGSVTNFEWVNAR